MAPRGVRGARPANLAGILVALMAVFALVTCQDAPLNNPAAPAPAPPPVADLVIGGLQTPLSVGQSVQLSASVKLADGLEKLVDVNWESSDTSIASVSSSGMVTIVGQGGANITANAYERNASVHLRVPFTVGGIVHESAPTEDVPIPGANVVVREGPDDGVSAITDSAGRFTLELESARLTLAVSKSGYDPTTMETSARERPSIALVPDAIPIFTRFAGGLCADWEFFYGPQNPQNPPRHSECVGTSTRARHFFNVHRSGPIEIALRWIYREDYSSEYTWLELKCDRLTLTKEFLLSVAAPCCPPGVLSEASAEPTTGYYTTPNHWKLTAPSAAACALTVGPYASFKVGIAQTSYEVDVTHPK